MKVECGSVNKDVIGGAEGRSVRACGNACGGGGVALQEVCEGRKIGRMPGGMQLASGRFVAALPSSRYLLVLGMAYVGLYVCSQGSAGLGSDLSQSVTVYACTRGISFCRAV